ncbi:MAG: hypothetical protein ACYC2U_01055 [Candidatus Amoebophilus sp.]
MLKLNLSIHLYIGAALQVHIELIKLLVKKEVIYMRRINTIVLPLYTAEKQLRKAKGEYRRAMYAFFIC